MSASKKQNGNELKKVGTESDLHDVELTNENGANGGISINIDVSNCEEKGDIKENGVCNGKNGDLLGIPRSGHRLSIMEEESAKDRMRTSILKQCSAILKQGDHCYTKESLHKTLQDEDFLERIFRLFDIECKGCLVQLDWIEFLKERLTSEKQLDFVEQVESVAYVLCGNGEVTLEHFFRIFKSKYVSDKLFRAADASGDCLSADKLMEFITTITSPRSRNSFDPRDIQRLEELFRKTVGDKNEITREQFQQIVVSKNPFFTERVFQLFDADDSGTVSLAEFLSAAQRFVGQSPDDKIRFLFKVYDLDGDGLIQPRELTHVLRACMTENGMTFSDSQLGALTAAMFADGRGALTFEALRDQLKAHAGLVENLTISIDRWLIPPKPHEEKLTFTQRLAKLKPHQLSWQYISNNTGLVAYWVIFIGLNIGLFVARLITYRHTNGYVMVARGCGQCLNLCGALLATLMLRASLSQLQSVSCCSALPLHLHVSLHARAAVLLLAHGAVHTAAHLGNLLIYVINDPVLNAEEYTAAEWLLTSRPQHFGLVPGFANPSGLLLCVLLVIVAVCSRPSVRRRGSFELFYWTHLLYIPIWILLIIHAPNFWKWFIVPGTAYVFERILRVMRLRSSHGRTYISHGVVLPSRVLHVAVARPRHFEYRAGDYVYVCVPRVAAAEWHPFTVSSAPEQRDYLWFHIRAVGGWTNRLYEYFEKQQERLHAGQVEAYGSGINGEGSRRSSKQSTSGAKKRSVDFSPEVYTNEAFTSDEEIDKETASIGDKKSNLLNIPLKMTLEKSLSMPDMKTKAKKKDHLYDLRDQMNRCESERNFDECEIKQANLKALALAYKSPQNKTLAESFKYVREKPTIIAFKTPSMDDCEKDNLITVARRRLSKSISPDKDDKDIESAKKNTEDNGTDENEFANYPVGKPLEIYLDGPYGSASSAIFSASHAVLVAAGIGVTPAAAVLQSVLRRHEARRRRCPDCGYVWLPADKTDITVNKLDFFWINRSQQSFEWFVHLLSQLEMTQAEMSDGEDRFLEMHMYITSALQRNDMKAVGLQLALDLLHEKSKRDLITGLKTRTNAGRPNWDKVFQQLQQQNKGKITVFFCGPPQLGRVLRNKCDQFGFEFRKEVF